MSNNISASVLAFERNITPSDGIFYQVDWNNRLNLNKEWNKLTLKEKTLRGTIGNRQGKKTLKNREAFEKSLENSNIQRVDTCYLDHTFDTLVVKCSLKLLPLTGASTCNDSDCNRRIKEIISSYRDDIGFQELAYRYSYNIAKGGLLWRNAIGAEKISVHVKECFGNEDEFSFEDCENIPRNSFEKSIPQENEILRLSKKIASIFECSNSASTFLITTFAQIGSGQEVYPSEEFIDEKSNSAIGSKSKVLFSTQGHAALHSQKIGNAIRTIDTWHPSYKNGDFSHPIAIEPYGAVTTRGIACRHPSEGKKDFYNLFDNWLNGNKPEQPEDQHFVMAVLIRGGVFGKPDAKKK